MHLILWTLLFLVAGGLFAWQMVGRSWVLFKARKDDGRDYSLKTWPVRLKNTFIYAFAQKKFFQGEQPSGLMHAVIFWGFVVLSIQVLMMFGRGWIDEFRVPGFQMSLLGGPYGFLKDIFQLAVMGGVCIALYRWLILKPTRLYGFLPAEEKLRNHSHWEAIVILLFIFTIMASGFIYDAGRMAYLTDADTLAEKSWQPISRWIASWFGENRELAETLSEAAWWAHNLVILTFLNLLPRSKHFHIITAIPNVFLGRIDSRGHIAKKDFTAETPVFGRSKPDQFTWKQVLDMYSCTECGRCSSFCPATATGKLLAPRQFLVNLRDMVYAQQNPLIKGGAEFQEVVGEGKAVSDEVVWSCVACRACEEACPVNIEYVEKIIDLRQHLVQEASRFPPELGRAFKGLETQSNPWGISSAERANWAEGLDVPRIQEKPDVEYLYYVGCGGSFDQSNRNSTRSFAEILKRAGVSFAILGTDELCNGETARRLGNEYLFQTMAEALVTKVKSHNVKKILVNCPHCFNTLKNEYPDFGGSWEVIHAAAFVGKLVDEGKVKLDGQFDKKVVYHDSCYYGRYNDVYDEPRNLIRGVPGTQLEEMYYCERKGTCCGAGGGRMWMEEKADQRVNVMRTNQALEKKPQVIATSCPYCRIMIGSGVNEKGVADSVKVMDVMEIVATSMKGGESAPA